MRQLPPPSFFAPNAAMIALRKLFMSLNICVSTAQKTTFHKKKGWFSIRRASFSPIRATVRWFSNYVDSTYFLKLSRMACHPFLCISKEFSLSASKVMTTAVCWPAAWKVTATFLPAIE